MKVTSVALGELPEEYRLRILGVQLLSPFVTGELSIGPRSGVPKWDSSRDSAEARVRRAQLILETLLSLEVGPQIVRVIAFPEYSIPKAAHKEIDFSLLSSSSKSIIIPGTYFEDSKSSAKYKQNVCKIYLPTEDVLEISKLNPTDEESKFIARATSAPNCANIFWEMPGRSRVSLNIYLCRDYLMGKREFRRDDRVTRRRPTGATEVDFVEEGLNLVLMHTDETRLFEGVGGIDLRGLRGQRRMSFFVNAAQTGSQLGSALIGAASKRERDDVVASLPSDQEGVLCADVRLFDVHETTVRPGKSVDGPIGVVSNYDLIDDGSVINIREARSSQTLPTHRAIWRPAFLEAIERCITIELYGVKKLSAVEHIFKKNEVPRTYAGIIRGVHDIIVRRYAHKRELLKEGGAPDFTLNSSEEVQKTLKDALRGGDVQRIVISPRDIMKYRGHPTDDGNFDDQLARIREQLHFGNTDQDRRERSELLGAVLRVAEGCEPTVPIPDTVNNIFFSELEETIPVGDESDIRETYIFIKTERWLDGKDAIIFEKAVIVGELMGMDIVREIFRITQRLDPAFQYLIKLKCITREADKLLKRLRSWGESHSVDIQTRTFEITEYLAKSSLWGIALSRLGDSGVRFLASFRDKFGREYLEIVQRAEAQTDYGNWVLMRIADAVDVVEREMPRRVVHMRTKAFQFYAALLLNFVATGRERSQRLSEVRTAWRACFDELEQSFDQALDRLQEVGVLDKTEKRADAVKKYAFRDTKDETWDKLKTDFGVQFLGVAQIFVQDGQLSAQLKMDRERLVRVLRPLRNKFFHAEAPEKLEELVDLRCERWEERIDKLEDSIIAIMHILSRVLYIQEQTRPPAAPH